MLPVIFFISNGAAGGGSFRRTGFLFTTVVGFTDWTKSALEVLLMPVRSFPVCRVSTSSPKFFRLNPATGFFFPTEDETVEVLVLYTFLPM